MPTLPKPVVTDEVSPAGTSFGLVLLGGPREGSDTACTVPEVMLIWRIGLINISPTGFDHEPGKTGMTSGTPSGPQVAAERGGRPEEPGSCAQSAGRSHVVVSELRVMGSSSPLTSVPVALARDSQGPGGFASGRRFAKAREACERVRGIATERARRVRKPQTVCEGAGGLRTRQGDRDRKGRAAHAESRHALGRGDEVAGGCVAFQLSDDGAVQLNCQ